MICSLLPSGEGLGMRSIYFEMRTKALFHMIDVVRESEKEVILNLFISRMDKGKEFNINLHFKRITAKKEILDGIIISEKLYK